MSAQYPVPKSGVDALRDLITGLQAQINALRSAAGTSSAVLSDPTDGSRIFLGNGNILMWDDYATNPDGYGRIYTDPVAGLHYFRMFPPHSAGTGSENSVTLRGTAPGTAGAFWIYTDGQAVVSSDDLLFLSSGGRSDTTDGDHIESVTGIKYVTTTGRHTMKADGGIDIWTGGSMRLYELPTTGSAANIRLDPGSVELQYVTSSLRYKQDIEDAPVDTAAFLRLRPRSWRDKGQVAADPENTTRNIGFIAEEVHELGLPFVDFDEQGRPDALQYDRFMAGAVQVMQEQAAQIAALSARLEALENA